MVATVSSTKNVKIGVCKITFGATDLGYTQGGVDVQVQTNTHKTTVDQFGQTPISEYIMGRTIAVTAPLAETTLANLAATMPGTTLAGTTAQQASVSTGIGSNLRDTAQILRLHPVGLADTDMSEDLVIPLANTAGAMKYAYKVDTERVFNVTFNGYPDDTGKLFYIGPDAPT